MKLADIIIKGLFTQEMLDTTNKTLAESATDLDLGPEPKSLYQQIHERFPMIPIERLAESWELWFCIERCMNHSIHRMHDRTFIDAIIREFSVEWDSDIPFWFEPGINDDCTP